MSAPALIETEKDLEKLIPQERLAEKLNVSVRTLNRWATDGFHGVKLETVRIGGGVYYTPQAVEAFRTETKKATAGD